MEKVTMREKKGDRGKEKTERCREEGAVNVSVARGEKHLTIREREREHSVLVSISVSATTAFHWRRQFP